MCDHLHVRVDQHVMALLLDWFRFLSSCWHPCGRVWPVALRPRGCSDSCPGLLLPCVAILLRIWPQFPSCVTPCGRVWPWRCPCRRRSDPCCPPPDPPDTAPGGRPKPPESDKFDTRWAVMVPGGTITAERVFLHPVWKTLFLMALRAPPEAPVRRNCSFGDFIVFYLSLKPKIPKIFECSSRKPHFCRKQLRA